MAAMKRERQFDMFDVATGVCELDDYLTQRYSENDISSKFWIEPADQVDELRPPQDGKQVIIPIQGPSVPSTIRPAPASEPLPTRPPWEQVSGTDNPPPTRPSWEAPTSPASSVPLSAPESPALGKSPALHPHARAVEPPSLVPTASPPSPSDPSPEASASPPSMADLLAQFHQATKAYQERTNDEPA